MIGKLSGLQDMLIMDGVDEQGILQELDTAGIALIF